VIEKSKFDIPMIIYWSIESNIRSIKAFNRHILSQHPELVNLKLNKNKIISNGSSFKRRIYESKKIQCFLVVD